MRSFLTAVMCVVVSVACCAGDAVDNIIRVPVLNGIYSVEAPSDWHLEISGVDFTATFAEDPEADGTLVISAPNPAVEDIADYTVLAAEALLNAFGGGEITGDVQEEIDGFPVYTLWFAFTADGTEFHGWAKTVNFDGVAVQGMALATAEQFDLFMQSAGPIFDSIMLDTGMIEDNIDLLRDVGVKVLESLEPEEAL